MSQPTSAVVEPSVPSSNSTAAPSNQPIDDLLGVELPSIDLHTASASFWGFVSSAASTIKDTTKAVVSEISSDIQDFKASLIEENPQLFEDQIDATNDQTEISSQSPSHQLLANEPSVSNADSSTDASSSPSSPESTSWPYSIASNLESIGSSLWSSTQNILPTIQHSFIYNDENTTTHTFSHTANTQISHSHLRQTHFESKLQSMQSDPKSYIDTPCGPDDDEFNIFCQQFLQDWVHKTSMEASRELELCSLVSRQYKRLVTPEDNTNSSVSSQQFWCNYFYRKRILLVEEEKRQRVVNRIQQQTHDKLDDLTWDDEDPKPSAQPSQEIHAISPAAVTDEQQNTKIITDMSTPLASLPVNDHSNIIQVSDNVPAQTENSEAVHSSGEESCDAECEPSTASSQTIDLHDTLNVDKLVNASNSSAAPVDSDAEQSVRVLSQDFTNAIETLSINDHVSSIEPVPVSSDTADKHFNSSHQENDLLSSSSSDLAQWDVVDASSANQSPPSNTTTLSVPPSITQSSYSTTNSSSQPQSTNDDWGEWS